MRKGGNSCTIISTDNNHTLLPDTQAAVRYNTPAQSKAWTKSVLYIWCKQKFKRYLLTKKSSCALSSVEDTTSIQYLVSHHTAVPFPSQHLSPKVLSQDYFLSLLLLPKTQLSSFNHSSKCACQTNKDRPEAIKNWAKITTPLCRTSHLITKMKIPRRCSNKNIRTDFLSSSPLVWL